MKGLFLIAQIAGRGVAIESTQVDSVVDIGEAIAVPRTTGAVRGLAALRSRVVTVIDPAIMLGMPPTVARRSRAVISLIDGHCYAFLVDALEDVALFVRHPLSTGIVVDGPWRRAGLGIVERDGEPLIILDLAILLPQIPQAA